MLWVKQWDACAREGEPVNSEMVRCFHFTTTFTVIGTTTEKTSLYCSVAITLTVINWMEDSNADGIFDSDAPPRLLYLVTKLRKPNADYHYVI